jgi:small-conductance mechanosensitive channel
MDRHTLMVIIVTAAVTTTVTVVVGWILNFFKLQVASTLMAKAKTSGGKTVIKVLLCVFMLVVNGWDLLRHLNAPGPPTRYEVLFIVLSLSGVCIWFGAIVGLFARYYFVKKYKAILD